MNEITNEANPLVCCPRCEGTGENAAVWHDVCYLCAGNGEIPLFTYDEYMEGHDE